MRNKKSVNTASRAFCHRIDGVFPVSFLEVMSPELLDILVCPRSKKKLRLADSALLDKVNGLIRSGKCVEVSGKAVNEPATEGLFEPETGTFYFVRDEIPVLIYDNAVELK